MTKEQCKMVLAGQIGHFWPIDNGAHNLEDAPQSGFVQLGESGLVELTTLDENPVETFDAPSENRLDSPDAVTGSTEASTVLILDVRTLGSKLNIFGEKASVRRFGARTLIAGVSLGKLQSCHLYSLEASFLEIDRWAGMVATTLESSNDDRGNPSKVSIVVGEQENRIVHLDAEKSLCISSSWSVRGPESNRTAYAPASISCRSERAVSVFDLLEPILAAQDLINMAHDGFVAVDSGSAVADDMSGKKRSTWNTLLMQIPHGARTPNKMSEFPHFYLSDLGEIDAMERWVNLTKRHRRAVKPLVDQYRSGPYSPELKMMEIAAGIEYWASSHRRSTEWASEGFHPLAVANYIGEPFAKWVGDPMKWSDKFWDRYTSLKHVPSFDPNPYEIKLLADVGAHLLEAALLTSIACNGEIFKNRYFQSSRIRNLGIKISSYLDLDQ